LFDLLIVKRTLAIKGVDEVAISESEPDFIAALTEFGTTGLADPRFYLNPFALHDTKSGYRPMRYRSNGTNTTIAGAAWQRVIALTADKPRKARLADGYESALKSVILIADNTKSVPSVVDAAIWYWRGRDLEEIVANATDDAGRFGRLRDAFVDRVGLTDIELKAIFEETLPPTAEAPWFASEAPQPSEYLPLKILDDEEADEQDSPSEVSFDLVVALAAKNFVVLTGPSGTGKSRAALKLAEGLQRLYAETHQASIFELVPVGPDWTSPKRLLGFRTPFGKERKLADGTSTHESFEITETIRLILRASSSDAADVPHILVLDEMNLSHVERYFAPFLSLMEASAILQGESGVSLVSDDDLKVIAAILDDEDPGSPEAVSAKSIVAEGRSVVLPPNLFIVGTVNVDETTYMFSPKVLDRAHVLELNSERPSNYLTGTSDAAAERNINVKLADTLLKKGVTDREEQKQSVKNPSSILDDLVEFGLTSDEIAGISSTMICALDGCYDLLEPIGFSFAYRVSKDVFIYVHRWIEAGRTEGLSGEDILSGWTDALDKALFQKVLPKLHGNRRVLGDSLRALSAFLAGGDANSTPAAAYALGGTTISITGSKLTLTDGGEQMALCRRKLDVMHGRLVATGYVSFVT
jgi:hypothetical protein